MKVSLITNFGANNVKHAQNNVNFTAIKTIYNLDSFCILDKEDLKIKSEQILKRSKKLLNKAQAIRQQGYKNREEVMKIFDEGRRIGFENLKKFEGRDIEVAFEDGTPVAIAEKINGQIIRRTTFGEFLDGNFMVKEIIIKPSTNDNKKLSPFNKGLIRQPWSCAQRYSFDMLKFGKLTDFEKGYSVSSLGDVKADEKYSFDTQDLSKLGSYHKNICYGLFTITCDEEIEFNRRQNLIIYKKGVEKGQRKTKEQERLILTEKYDKYCKNVVFKKNNFTSEKSMVEFK